MKRGFYFIGENRIGARKMRMPQAIAGFILAYLTPVSVGLTLGLAANTIALGIGYAVTAAGAFLLNKALQEKPASPKPSDVQSNIKQEISPRRRYYHRNLAGSVIVFGFRRGEKSYLLHYICEGPIEGFVSFRLDSKPVTLDANGFVTTNQYVYKGRSRVQLLTTLGTMLDEPFAELLAAFPELDTPLTPFRHRGCAMVLQIVEQVPQSKLADVYPNNMPTLQVVIDGWREVYDPRSHTFGFSGNAGSCLLTEVADVYGLNPDDEDEINLRSFADFADHCDENVALRGGGTEKRYRCAGMLSLDAENEARLLEIAKICNADVYLDEQGRFAVREKMRSTPGIALRARNGDHLSIQMEGGRSLQQLFNTAKFQYTEPALNYKANEVRWQHAGLLDEDGTEYSDTVSGFLCPSGTQAQRLAKLALYESNPDFIGSLTSGPQALDLIEDYVFTLDLAPEDAFERVACASGVIEYDGEAMTVTSPFVIFREGATDWNPVVDEQNELIVPPDLPSNVDDVLLTVTVAVELQANSAPVLRFSWTAAGGASLPDSYSQQVQVSAADANDWHDASVNQNNNTAIYAPVADGGAYDWQIRNISGGKTFDYQGSSVPVTVVVDQTAPQALISFSASDGSGQFIANFGTANDGHLDTVAVFRVPAGGSLNEGAHEVGRYAVSRGISYALPILSDPGTFDIYARPFNRSSIPGPLAGPDTAIIS
ncbi:hypothetical protein [Rhizobium halophytocola]|uniref:Tip attachment protein J domain-containing protein n=1 Tax=Rhizobium halophytocola TaxID=735519 RepID=A0ABS4DVI7_9HYPH|nr:hypothetical protein [Rhizobium halophytocola]MBP1849701.1 hypothetical protein [Rhizobium halophytocola]